MTPAFPSLPRPGDLQAAALGLTHWHEQADRLDDAELRAFARSFAEAPHGRAVLEAVFGNSPYLSQSLVREIAFARRLVEDGPDDAFGALLREQEAQCRGVEDTDRLMEVLRVTKRRAALLIALADIGGAWPLERVTGALSELAEAALRQACGHLLRKAARGGSLIIPDPENPEIGSGLIVLGMGKLGARELNYSSDIDLIVLYDDQVVQTAQPDLMARTFIRLARDLVRIMEERTKDGYVFRTDLRLRPDPGATPLAVSVSAAEAYYGSLGQNWERAAMIKARPVAGDGEAARHLLGVLRSFVWRRHLDFAAIQDIHSIKRQINAHRGFRTTAVEGHDVKIGRGGIREIEFFAQTQQLIFGGRDPRLRTSGTVESLHALVAAGRVAPETAGDLERAYGFLRRVEHRVQMIEDHQTHRLPADPAAVDRLAVFLGYDDPAAFRAELTATLATVEDHYAALFEEAPALSGPGNLVFTGTEDDPETLKTLERLGFRNAPAIAATIRGWHHGRYRATRSTRARELLTELTPALLEALATTPSPDEAFLRFDEFLGRLPAGVQLFTMFYSNPALLGLVAEVMGTAPRLAEILARSPSRLDAVLTPGFFEHLPERDELEADLAAVVGVAAGFEDVLDAARRWSNDQRFRAGLHILRNITDGDACGPFLSDIADLSVGALVPSVLDEFSRRHGRFAEGGMAILALGKLGSRQMTIRSDLDLIIVYEPPADGSLSDGPKPLSATEYYTKVTQRLVNAVTVQTGEGALYEVDMRLRPSGNKGPLAVSIDGFAAYQRDAAWTWEHMALTRGRVIWGPAALCRRLDAEVAAVLTRPRDPDALLRDVASMRARIDREFGTRDLWDTKYVRGGQIDAEFVAQYLMLRHAARDPSVLSANMATALDNLATAGLLDLAAARDLVEALRMWRRIQGFLRLTTEGGFDAEAAPEALKRALFRAVMAPERDFDFAAMTDHIAAVAGRTHAHFRALVEDPAARLSPAPDQERP
ncbi:bifunctional [glutamine synthetase] adenylyltransferase/[glutamine synthetase]-adenylyl-L-tyrosine phosphorylase [Arenibaculum pallidiluteum]|uniref:bifunctional [glutamine synthetase] adenylyltransferase/[glutamine synthetase]-adenylyl-L-tyrosine phosphorylase n=1 Tax=Arenibaculum pallidiluteum TaxID=2812559 RepID=UPI002E2B1A2A|nr:bifunctional [glutamine synthetase] adenylyltransferase/[glutamine synthetase]-adenylyl-L-tyrosine phosphorylase [Arenibaculum pallidiluteum]